MMPFTKLPYPISQPLQSYYEPLYNGQSSTGHGTGHYPSIVERTSTDQRLNVLALYGSPSLIPGKVFFIERLCMQLRTYLHT